MASLSEYGNALTGQRDFGNYANDTYREEQKKIQAEANKRKQSALNTINSLTGEAGYNNALQNARQTAASTAENATASASNAAIQQALQMGLSKSSAAMNAGNTAASTYAQTYGNKLSEEQSRMQQYQQMELETNMEQMRQEAEKQKREYQAKLAEKERSIQRAMQIGQLALKAGSWGASAFANSDFAQNLDGVGLKDWASQVKNRGQGSQADYDASLTGGDQNLARWTTGMGMTSDKRVKKRADIKSLLENLNTLVYKYDDNAPDADNDIHVGIAAQDVEKTNPEMVDEVNNVKRINMQELLESTIAGVAELYKVAKSLNKEEDNDADKA